MVHKSWVPIRPSDLFIYLFIYLFIFTTAPNIVFLIMELPSCHPSGPWNLWWHLHFFFENLCNPYRIIYIHTTPEILRLIWQIEFFWRKLVYTILYNILSSFWDSRSPKTSLRPKMRHSEMLNYSSNGTVPHPRRPKTLPSSLRRT
jgi:hypothetical protein